MLPAISAAGCKLSLLLQLSNWAKTLTITYISTVWTVVQTVLTATFSSYGDRQVSTLHKINIPEPIYKNSAQLITSLHQIWYKSTHWELLGKWVKYNKNYFYSFFSQVRVQVRPVDGFLRAIKLQFNVKHPQNGTDGFFARKRLTLRVLKSKLPLIIIVAP